MVAIEAINWYVEDQLLTAEGTHHLLYQDQDGDRRLVSNFRDGSQHTINSDNSAEVSYTFGPIIKANADGSFRHISLTGAELTFGRGAEQSVVVEPRIQTRLQRASSLRNKNPLIQFVIFDALQSL